MESACESDTGVVGHDTNFLVLLCSHADISGHGSYFRPESKSNSRVRRVLDIRKSSDSLVRPSIATSISCTHSLGVARRHAYMD